MKRPDLRSAVFPTALYFPAYGGTSFNVIAFRDPVTENELSIAHERLSRAALTGVGGPAGAAYELCLGQSDQLPGVRFQLLGHRVCAGRQRQHPGAQSQGRARTICGDEVWAGHRLFRLCVSAHA